MIYNNLFNIPIQSFGVEEQSEYQLKKINLFTEPLKLREILKPTEKKPPEIPGEPAEPGKCNLANQPDHLNVELMPNQLRAIKWMQISDCNWFNFACRVRREVK